MFTGNKEKTMATSPVNRPTNMDVARPMTQEELPLIAQNNQENENTKYDNFSSAAGYLPEKSPENKSDENLETKTYGYVNKNAAICDCLSLTQ